MDRGAFVYLRLNISISCTDNVYVLPPAVTCCWPTLDKIGKNSQTKSFWHTFTKTTLNAREVVWRKFVADEFVDSETRLIFAGPHISYHRPLTLTTRKTDLRRADGRPPRTWDYARIRSCDSRVVCGFRMRRIRRCVASTVVWKNIDKSKDSIFWCFSRRRVLQ